MNKLFALVCLLSISYAGAYYYCTCRDVAHCGHLAASCEYSNSIVQLTAPQYCHKMYGLVCIRNNMKDTTCIRQGCMLPRNNTIIKIINNTVPVVINNTIIREVPYYVNISNAELSINKTLDIVSTIIQLAGTVERPSTSIIWQYMNRYMTSFRFNWKGEVYNGIGGSSPSFYDGRCLLYYQEFADSGRTTGSSYYNIYNNTEYVLLVFVINHEFGQSYSENGSPRPYLNTTNNIVYINNTIYEEVPVYINNTIIREVPYYVNMSNCIDAPEQSQIVVTDHKYLYELLTVLVLLCVSVLINLYVCFKTYKRQRRYNTIDSELNNL